jgi:hypothetical protein
MGYISTATIVTSVKRRVMGKEMQPRNSLEIGDRLLSSKALSLTADRSRHLLLL